MVSTDLSICIEKNEPESTARKWLYWVGLFMLALAMFYMPDVYAQSNTGTQGLCKFAGWLKSIVSVVAIIAIILLVLNSFFMKSSVIGDIIIYVIVGCAIVAAATYLVGLSGLTTTCTI